MKQLFHKSIFVLFSILLMGGTQLSAKEVTTQQLNQQADATIKTFTSKVTNADKFLKNAKGYLVFPKIIKGAFFVGGSYGKGVLRVNGKTEGYYDVSSLSAGFQFGAKEYSMIVVFGSDNILKNFKKSNGFESEMDASLVLSNYGVGEAITSLSYEKPITTFLFGWGLFNGYKIYKIKRLQFNKCG
jgi:lipid-binding SYLF domain-containing protein